MRDGWRRSSAEGRPWDQKPTALCPALRLPACPGVPTSRAQSGGEMPAVLKRGLVTLQDKAGLVQGMPFQDRKGKASPLSATTGCGREKG